MARRIVLFLGLTLLSAAASAQGIGGKWNASVDSAQGPLTLVFEFVAEGTELMGSMIVDIMGAIPISDGKIDGNELSFKMAFEGIPGAAMIVNFVGELDGDELTLTSTIEGELPPGTEAERTFVAERAREQ